MNILRTIIRFAIILVFVVLLVFLSVTLFKLIPMGINQLATASLSLTGLDEATTTTTTVIDRTPQYVATTTGGLNGVVTQSVGDIVISDKPTAIKTNTVVKTVYVPKTVYYPAPTPTYTYTGLKNIKATLISVGIIDRYSGQFVTTNSYTSDDTIVVKYRISNDQDTATGPFSMRVDMPAIASQDQSKYINNINIPGKSSYNVEARFNGLNTSVTPVVRIYTDINNNVTETDENDNTLSVTINNVVNNNTNNCYYYSNGYYYNNCNNNNNNNNYNNCNQYNQNNTECYDYCARYNCGSNNGSPNLAVSYIQAGRMVNGSFVTQSSFNYGERIYVRMRVRNTGGTFSSNWATRNTFTDPTGSYRVLTTNSERPLAYNEEVTITYEVDSLARGNTTFTVNIDSNGNVYETNENDNTATLGVYVY